MTYVASFPLFISTFCRKIYNYPPPVIYLPHHSSPPISISEVSLSILLIPCSIHSSRSTCALQPRLFCAAFRWVSSLCSNQGGRCRHSVPVAVITIFYRPHLHIHRHKNRLFPPSIRPSPPDMPSPGPPPTPSLLFPKQKTL